MRWFEQLQFAAALGMPDAVADEYGTTVNGLWASPRTADEVDRAHAKGRRVLFSVPLIALTPHVYEAEATRYLLDEVCRDVSGEPSEVDWYYWEEKPVYAACIYSDVFRRYLLDICREAAARGHDVVNLDEINTSIGLIDRDPGGCGFCPRCLERFRLATGVSLDDESLRAALVADDDLYARYRSFHEQEAFAVVSEMIEEIRSWASDCAITANLAYLGNHVPAMGTLWGPLWGPLLDFVMMENSYTLEHRSPHLLLPRGTFGPWYRLASALTGAPTFIVPSILVPKQFAGEERGVYYQLMFLEAYANRGRFAYYWWPGADHETMLRATAPPELKAHVRFLREHRAYYEEAEAENDLAVVYLDSAISADPSTHLKYLALAQALAERGYQFDVVYGGDGRFTTDSLGDLSRYRVLALPEATTTTGSQQAALEEFDGRVVTYDDDVLTRLWETYDPADRELALAPFADLPRIAASAPTVSAIRYRCGNETVVHLLNYAYDAENDTVLPAEALEVAIPWPTDEEPHATLLTKDGASPVGCRVVDGRCVVAVDRLELYALLVLAPA